MVYGKILMTAIALLTLAGCGSGAKDGRGERGVLARVGGAVLMEDDVKGIYSAGGSAADSLALLEAHVNQWVKRQVKLQEAERLATGSGIDVEAMVNDYRNSLITHRLDQYYVDKYIDTLIPSPQIEEYYNRNLGQFLLDRTIVKGRVVRVPALYRQTAKLKELMGSPRPERQKDFLDLCEKNNFSLAEFETWTDFSEMLSYLPVTRGRDYDYLLRSNKVQELSDADFKYYVEITESRQKGAQAPLERVEHIVRRIIYNLRSREVILRIEDSLYNAALTDGKVLINITIDN